MDNNINKEELFGQSPVNTPNDKNDENGVLTNGFENAAQNSESSMDQKKEVDQTANQSFTSGRQEAEHKPNTESPSQNGTQGGTQAGTGKTAYRFDPQTGRPIGNQAGGCTYAYGPGHFNGQNSDTVVYGRAKQNEGYSAGYAPNSEGYRYSNNPGVPPMPPRKAPKKPLGKGFVCATLVIGILLSGVVGFAAAEISNSLHSTNNNSSSAVLGNVTVNYVDPKKEVTSDTTSATYVNNIAGQSVVAISTETITTSSFYGQYVTEGAGSGVIISSGNGISYIITCAHVVSGASHINVTLNNKAQDQFEATLVGIDSVTDIAVISVNTDGLETATIGDYSSVDVGDYVVAIGNPLGTLGGSVTDGIISALDRIINIDGQSYTLLQTNAEINPGNSGGGLFDKNGNLIGIVNAKSSGSSIEGIGFAIPIKNGMDVATELIKNGYVTGRVKLGVTLFNITSTNDLYKWWQYQKYITTYGVYVESSETDHFKTGDRIVAIDGVEVSTSSEIKALLLKYKVGDVVKVSLYRQNSSGISILTEVEHTLEEIKQN